MAVILRQYYHSIHMFYFLALQLSLGILPTSSQSVWQLWLAIVLMRPSEYGMSIGVKDKRDKLPVTTGNENIPISNCKELRR